MTDVLVNLTRHTATGRVPATGVLRWTPTRRVHIDAPTDGAVDEVVVPAPFTVQVDGPTTIAVDPSGTSWAWTVHEATQGGRTIRTVAVPDSPTPIDYGDLVDIDPATLTPAAEPTAAWWAAHDSLVDQVAGITVDPAEIGDAVADYLTANPVDAPVTSVNGETGAVVLDATDVGADPAGTAQGLVDALVIPDPDLTGYVQTTDLRLSDARTPTAHGHPASQISDSTTVGRSVVTATDAAAARTAIGAGTSNLALGTTASTAKAGNYSPPAASTTAQGIVELATTAETTTGTDTTRAVTPEGVKAVADTKANTSHSHTADPQPINAQAGAHTLVASDAGKLVTVTAATAVDVTVPAGVFTAGQRVDVLDLGAERVTFVAGSGMTLGGTPTLVSRAQYSAHSVVFLSASSAVVVGDLA